MNPLKLVLATTSQPALLVPFLTDACSGRSRSSGDFFNSCIVITILALASLSFANDKPKVYDYTGTISYPSIQPVSEAHMNVNGYPSDAYCSTRGVSYVTCTDTPARFKVTFQNGNWTALAPNDLDFLYSHCDMNITTCDPLLQILATPGKHEFHYRLDAFKTLSGAEPFYCVGFSVQDKHGKHKPQERCYKMMTVLSPDGKVIYMEGGSLDRSLKTEY
jgi:hypothetical protein